ncbi:hypothetical protein D1007_11180 [Hordeum vulgare]|nr:hypothetical protein D1007_11180 [Hordeum vulgare]
MPSAATLSSSMGSSDIEFALNLQDIADCAANADCIGALACRRASFSYHRLPEPPLRLTVRKLDDSYFARVEPLLLMLQDEKMTDDKATLRAFGIKDGDEATSCSLRQSLLVICVPSIRKRCMFLSSFAVNIFSARTVSLNDSLVGLTFSLEAFSGASTGPGNAGPVPCSSAVPCSPFLVQPTNMKLSIDSLKQTIVYIS